MEKSNAKKNSFIKNILLLFSLISTLVLFISTIIKQISTDIDVELLLKQALSTISVILFLYIGFTSKKSNKLLTISACITLLLLNSLQLSSLFGLIDSSSNKLQSFSNKTLTSVITWAEKNKIEVEQDYEYSDMVEEYKVITQSPPEGTPLKNIKKIKVAISEGANPDKEIIIPNMLTWTDEKVLEFIKENHLTNIEVEYIESSKLENTVIEQEGSGNRKRSDLLKLTFSKGEEEKEEIKLINLENKSKIETLFYLKKYGINYEFKKDFSNKIKRDFVIKQDKKPGSILKIKEDKLTLTLSKGPKIIVPDLTKMSMAEITEWIIKNKLKVEFTEQYDDTVKDNKVIEANFKKGDEIEQKTLVKICISKGKLTMPKMSNAEDIKIWAEKYGIAYQEEYEFSDTIKKGDIIKTSHKEGQTIKKGETVTVTISQGNKATVPNLIGMKKQSAIDALKKAKLNYNFIYEYSNDAKDTVIKQSMQSGSETAEDTTITVTLSNGKRPTSTNNNSKASTNNNAKSNNSPNNNNNNNNTPSCTPKTYTIGSALRNIFTSYDGYENVKNALYSFFSQNYPGVNLSVVGISNSEMSSGSYISGLKPGSQVSSCNGITYTIEIAR